MWLKFRLVLMTLMFSLFHSKAECAIIVVSQSGPISDTKAAALLAKDGDTIDIEYNVKPYLAYETKWTQHNLLIRGVGTGMPILKAESATVTQKAIFVIQGNNTIIENIEFTNAKVPDKNGAGIRMEGTNLIVRHCVFSKNEDGILAGDNINSEIVIEHCEFDSNGFGDGYSHNLYINHVKRLIFKFNYSHDANIGHLLKSRAYENYILYNRFDSPLGGSPSREIDLPNGGKTVIIGNVLRQTTNDQNSNMIGYGLEGLSNPEPNDLILINNSLVNQKAVGSFISVASGTNLVQLSNNIFAGGGSTLIGNPLTIDSLQNMRTSIADAGFVNESIQDYHLMNTSWAVNKGISPGFYLGFDLLAKYEYLAVADSVPRKFIDKIDIGAFETDFSTFTNDLSNQKLDWIQNWGSSITNTNELESATIFLYDFQGKVVKKINLLPGEDFRVEQKGVFVIYVNYNGHSETKKLINLY